MDTPETIAVARAKIREQLEKNPENIQADLASMLQYIAKTGMLAVAGGLTCICAYAGGLFGLGLPLPQTPEAIQLSFLAGFFAVAFIFPVARPHRGWLETQVDKEIAVTRYSGTISRFTHKG